MKVRGVQFDIRRSWATRGYDVALYFPSGDDTIRLVRPVLFELAEPESAPPYVPTFNVEEDGLRSLAESLYRQRLFPAHEEYVLGRMVALEKENEFLRSVVRPPTQGDSK